MRDRGHPDDLLSAFLDDELDEPASSRVTHHLGACARCRDELEGLRRAREALRDLPDVQPPRALLAGVPSTAEESSSPRRLVLTAVGITGLGLLGLAFAVGGAEEGEVVPPVDVVVVDHVARTGGGPVIQPVDLDR